MLKLFEDAEAFLRMLTSISENSFLISGTIHSRWQSHSHLILDPGSAYYDDVGGGFAPSEVIVKSRFRMHDQVDVALDFMQYIRTFGQRFLYLTFLKVLMPHHGLYKRPESEM